MPESLDQFLDELLASEEVEGVPLLERAETLVGVRDDGAGDGGREARGTRAERPPEAHVVGGVVRLRAQPDHVHRVRETFQGDGSSIHVGDALDLPREMRHRRAREDLRGGGDPAQPRGEVQRAAAVATLDGHGLARVEPDPDRQWKRRIRDGLVHEPPLELDRRADRLPGRIEDRQCLVAAELDDRPAAALDRFTRDRRELSRERRGGLVAVLLREDRVPANIGDQERPDVGIVRPVRSLLAADHGGLWPTPQIRS